MKNKIPEKSYFENIYKDKDDPWGQTFIGQKIRNQNFVLNISSYFNNSNISYPVEHICDLAVGDGTLLYAMNDLFKKADIYDLMQQSIDLSIIKLGNKIDRNGANELPQIPSGQKYLYVLAIEVLCYFDEKKLKEFFSNVSDIIDSGGKLIFTIEPKYKYCFEDKYTIEEEYVRYTEPLRLFEVLAWAERKLILPDHSYHSKKIKVFSKIIFPIVPVLRKYHPFDHLAQNTFLGNIFYSAGKFLRLKHKRRLYICSKKDQ